jgi:hypothetical protein
MFQHRHAAYVAWTISQRHYLQNVLKCPLGICPLFLGFVLAAGVEILLDCLSLFKGCLLSLCHAV